MDNFGDPIKLTLPATATLVPVIRSVIGSAAAWLGYSVDEVEDLRLATSESCAYLLRAVSKAHTISVQVQQVANSLEVITSTAGGARAAEKLGVDEFITWQLLSVMTDEVAMHWTNEGPELRVRKDRADEWVA